MAEDTQTILGEIRALKRGQEEIALQLRVDTFWVRARDHVDYGLSVLQRIPYFARLCIFLGVCVAGAGILTRNAKLVFWGVDILFLSLMFVGK